MHLHRFAVFAVIAGCGGAPSAREHESPAPDGPVDHGGQDTPASELADRLPNAVVLDDALIVGGQPDEATLGVARDEGYRTVISLRTEGEPGTDGERATVEELGMRFVSIPVDRQTGLTEENARSLDAALSDSETGRAVLHCGSGNRVAALLALRAFFVEGIGIEAALERLRATGLTRLEERVREVMARVCEQDPERSC